MRTAAITVGALFLALGFVLMFAAGGENPDGGVGSWTCVADGAIKQACTYNSDSPQQVTADAAHATQNTIAGAAVLIAGAAMLGGGVAASRPRAAAANPGTYNPPPAGGYPPPGGYLPPGAYPPPGGYPPPTGQPQGA